MTLSATALNNCPFCASDQLTVVGDKHGKELFAECLTCWARGPVLHVHNVVRDKKTSNLPKVVELWNKRAVK